MPSPSNRSVRVVLWLLTLAVWSHVGLAGSGEPVAIIEDYSGDAGDYRVIREAVEIDVKALMELHAGDEVRLDAEQGELTLVYYDGARIDVNPGSKSHRVVGSRSAAETNPRNSRR